MAKLACSVEDLRVEKVDPGGCRLDPWRLVTPDGEEVGYMAPYPSDCWDVRLPPCWYPFAFSSRRAAQAKLRELQEMRRPRGYEQPSLGLDATGDLS